jgi:hypothetical protein
MILNSTKHIETTLLAADYIKGEIDGRYYRKYSRKYRQSIVIYSDAITYTLDRMLDSRPDSTAYCVVVYNQSILMGFAETYPKFEKHCELLLITELFSNHER